jgi:translation elongation factor EF-Ts
MTDEQEKLRQVRERTGQAYMECQRALVEAGGDVDRAVDLMRLEGETHTVDAKQAFNALFEPKRVAGEDE